MTTTKVILTILKDFLVCLTIAAVYMTGAFFGLEATMNALWYPYMLIPGFITAILVIEAFRVSISGMNVFTKAFVVLLKPESIVIVDEDRVEEDRDDENE